MKSCFIAHLRFFVATTLLIPALLPYPCPVYGETFPPEDLPRVTAVSGRPDIDDTADILWEEAPVLTLQGLDGNDPCHLTKVQVGWSEKGICIAFWCSELGPIRNPGPVGRDKPPWGSDCFEVMLSPGPDMPEKVFYIAVTPGSALLPDKEQPEDSSLPYDSYGNDSEWDCEGLIVLTCPWGEKGWKGLIVVPPEGLGIKTVEVPDVWRLNFSRFVPARGASPSCDSAWSAPKGLSPHEGASLGYLVLPVAEKPEKVTGDTQTEERKK